MELSQKIHASELQYIEGQRTEAESLVIDFHYSGRIPSNVQAVFTASIEVPGGLFGTVGKAVAAIFYTIPPTRWKEPIIELARLVRHPEYTLPLSALVAYSVKWMRRNGHDLLISFADSTHQHHGGIYQACNWKYAGKRDASMDGLVINGAFISGRACNHAYGTRSPERLKERRPYLQIEPHFDEGKHLYWLDLNRKGKEKATRLGLESLPYPKPNKITPEVIR
jgi:hypothetical protein